MFNDSQLRVDYRVWGEQGKPLTLAANVLNADGKITSPVRYDHSSNQIKRSFFNSFNLRVLSKLLGDDWRVKQVAASVDAAYQAAAESNLGGNKKPLLSRLASQTKTFPKLTKLAVDNFISELNSEKLAVYFQRSAKKTKLTNSLLQRRSSITADQDFSIRASHNLFASNDERCCSLPALDKIKQPAKPARKKVAKG